MSTRTRSYPPPPSEAADYAVTQYLTKLQKLYAPAKGRATVVRRQDNRIIVSVPLPVRVDERMRLFDQMAEVATELLVQTDQYIVLSAL